MNSPGHLPFFSDNDIESAVPMNRAIELMRDAFSQLSLDEANVPKRVSIEIENGSDSALFMPVYSSRNKRLGLKLVSVFPRNPEIGLPTVQALVLLMDATNGSPLAIMDGEYLTALRTGAASGLATDLLANKDAKTVGIFGAGAQGRTQLEGVCAVRGIERCLVFDFDQNAANSFAREMSERVQVDVIPADSDIQLKEMEIVCTATNSKDPVFEPTVLAPGTHVNAIGAYSPQMSEVPIETVERARLYVDQTSACLAEAGDIIKAIESGAIKKDHILGELGDLISGKVKGRVRRDEITLFKSVGNAIQDLVTADEVLRSSERQNENQAS